MSVLSALLAALAEHADVIEVLLRAIAGGADKEAIKKAIASAMIATSDRAMHEELGEK